MEDYPKNLGEFDERFATEEACRDYLIKLRWPDGFRCPRCRGPNISKFNKDDEYVAETLIRKFSVATVPGSGFGNAGAGHLRLSYSVPIPEIKEGLARFQKGLQHFLSSH